MKLFYLYCILGIIICCIECKGNTKQHTVFSYGRDTIRMNCDKCVIHFKYNEKDIEKARSQYRHNEDFYTANDDINYYLSNFFQQLDKNKVKDFEIKKKGILNLSGKYYLNLDSLYFFDLIFYDKNKKPQIAKPIDAMQILDEYFYKNDYDANDIKKYLHKNYKIDDSISLCSNDTTNYLVYIVTCVDSFAYPQILIFRKEQKRINLMINNSSGALPIFDPRDYSRIAVNRNYFTFEYTFRTDTSYYESYLTYKLIDTAIYLHKYSYIETDLESQKDFPVKIYSEKDFGKINIALVSAKFLNELRKKPPKF